MWNYERKESKKPYKVFRHYHTDAGSDIRLTAGETFAYSAEQAERNVSFKNGDEGEREIRYDGYTCTYEAVEM